MGEDISIAIKQFLVKTCNDTLPKDDIILKIIKACYKLFGFHPDAPREMLEKIIVTKPMQKLVLLQLELGSSFQGNSNVYSMARCCISLRDVLFAFSTVCRNVQMMIQHSATMNGQNTSAAKLFQFSFSKQDLIFSLIPIAKWFVKFINFLLQQSIILVNNPKDKQDNLVLGVLGAKVTRILILSILNEIRKINQLITKFPETGLPALNDSSIILRKVLDESPIDFEKFESHLTDIGNEISSLSTNIGNNDASALKANLEREPYMIVKGDIPAEFDSNIKQFLLGYFRNSILSNLNISKIYFNDTGGLKLYAEEYYKSKYFHLLQPLDKGLLFFDNDEKCRSSQEFTCLEIDDVTKEPLDNAKNNSNTGEITKKYKRCVRCGSVTLAGYIIPSDKTVVDTKISTRRWCSVFSRLCICSGMLHEM
ncbi:uncharacterized protein SCODWIG_03320 [Saccharomycodes ludwigii]|uniref:Mediator complex subunit 16 C-terminal domain-containing protein n=1 Tax=Saccharomycodes ludwigii TaxID=36035 RepID=A0A376BAE9_9ASCO|nr:uncharacterized protein SCODWIG_03320 [Saccharomycodes ludwigii]